MIVLSKLADEAQTSHGRQLFWHVFRQELSVSVCLFLFTICFFYRSVFQGKPISKLCRLANWDSVFQQYANSSNGSCDPSLVQLLLPNYFLVAKLWHSCTLPLWNCWSGCGMPLIGDIQASVFAPVRLALFFFPSFHTYNLILVFEIILCILGTYALARLLTLDRMPAVFAALTYSFCPYTLYYLELLSGTSQVLLPLLLASFVWTARKAGVIPALVATLFTASFVLSGHPESSLYGVALSVLFYAFIGLRPVRTIEKQSAYSLFLKLFFIGVLSVSLTAPVLFPFIEYLSCGDSYKYVDGPSAFAPWQGLVLNLLQPCYGPASPFLGVIAITLLAASFYVLRKQRATVIFLWFLLSCSVLLISRVGFLHDWLSVRPLSYLITVYLIPVYLLILTLLTGFGLQSISERLIPFRLLLVVSLFPMLLPLALFFANCNLHQWNFDETLPDLHFELLAILVNSFLGGVFLCLLFSLRHQTKNSVRIGGCLKLVVLAATILLNSLSLFATARTALPVQPFFDFPKTQVTEFLKEHKGRTLSIVEHVLKPNANIVYGISSLRVHNPLLPARFAEFTELCGAKLDEFHNQAYSAVTNVVDLASVKYLITQFKPLPPKYHLVHTTTEGIGIYENPSSLPEAYLVTSVLAASTKAEAKTLIQSQSFDAQSQAVIEAPADFQLDSQMVGVKPILVPLLVTRDSCNEHSISYSFPSSAVLVHTDTFYPGWHATIDGKEVPIVRANFLFRAIFVPPGSHSVRFFYSPLSLWLGALLASVALLIVAVLMLRSLVRERRKRGL